MATPEQTIVTIRGTTEYRIERHPNSDDAPYTLHGPRGAVYHLFRNEHTRHMLFAVNGRAGRKAPDWWFTDEGGQLRHL